MKRAIKNFILSLGIVLGLGVALVPALPVAAANPIDEACAVDPNSTICKNKGQSAGDILAIVVNTLLFVVGIISVIAVITGGIMYSVSGGDSGTLTKAKNTILFAVIGLVVSFLAYAIVNWVLNIF